jgi:HSP20 family protein
LGQEPKAEITKQSKSRANLKSELFEHLLQLLSQVTPNPGEIKGSGRLMSKLLTRKSDNNKRRTRTMPEQTKSVASTKQPTSPASLKLVPAQDLFERMQQLHDLIERRAFEIFDGNGKTFGHDLEDWFKAESELLHPVHIDVAESDGNLIVKAEVPGFTTKEMEIALEPRRVTITGKRESKEERKDKKTLYTEIRSDEVLRVLDLPAAGDTEKAAATLKDGVLELKMPKALPSKKVEITAKETKQDEQC